MTEEQHDDHAQRGHKASQISKHMITGTIRVGMHTSRFEIAVVVVVVSDRPTGSGWKNQVPHTFAHKMPSIHVQTSMQDRSNDKDSTTPNVEACDLNLINSKEL